MSDRPQYKYVRRVRSGWQARVWDGRFRDHINLGVYAEPRMAWHVVREYIHKGIYPDHLCPKYVRTCGPFFNASISTKTRTIHVGPYLFAGVAQARLFELIERRYPRLLRNLQSRLNTQESRPDKINSVLFPAEIETTRSAKKTEQNQCVTAGSVNTLDDTGNVKLVQPTIF